MGEGHGEEEWEVGNSAHTCRFAHFSAKLFLKAPVFSLTDIEVQGPQRSIDTLLSLSRPPPTALHAPAHTSYKLSSIFFSSLEPILWISKSE